MNLPLTTVFDLSPAEKLQLVEDQGNRMKEVPDSS